MQTIKAIETKYGGCLFRSRLEARYAVFLDFLGIKWDYEFEGFDLSSGYYLPDFYLYDFDMFLEIKPLTVIDPPEYKEFGSVCGKMIELSMGYKACILGVGLPELRGKHADGLVFLHSNSNLLHISPPVLIGQKEALGFYWQYCINKKQVVLAGNFEPDADYFHDRELTRKFTRFANISNGDTYDYDIFDKSREAAKSARFGGH